ncbi:hypothetical protein BCL76_102381 [Streptomyces sp. CG 926]|nr:hypothetical protein BCL76_102381 [Streptomyces sp. CG 926]
MEEYEIPIQWVRRFLLWGGHFCFNEPMASHSHTSNGRSDLEPFWPSRQDHDYDRECCRAKNAPAL